MTARPTPFDPPSVPVLPDFDALLARRDPPIPAIVGACGMAVLILAAALVVEGRFGLVEFAMSAIGAGLVVLGVRLGARREAMRAESSRLVLESLPLETLIQASTSPDVSERSRILIANFLNARHPGCGFGLDTLDKARLGRASPGGCGGGSCGGGCH